MGCVCRGTSLRLMLWKIPLQGVGRHLSPQARASAETPLLCPGPSWCTPCLCALPGALHALVSFLVHAILVHPSWSTTRSCAFPGEPYARVPFLVYPMPLCCSIFSNPQPRQRATPDSPAASGTFSGWFTSGSVVPTGDAATSSSQ